MTPIQSDASQAYQVPESKKEALLEGRSVKPMQTSGEVHERVGCLMTCCNNDAAGCACCDACGHLGCGCGAGTVSHLDCC